MSDFKAYPILQRPDLLAEPVRRVLEAWQGEVPPEEIEVLEIDPEFSDTDAFCEHYHIAPDQPPTRSWWRQDAVVRASWRWW